MTEPAPQIAKNYLAELERALAGMPDEVGREILAGIAEGLSGLDTAAAAERIELLGDPAFIAAEAREETRAVPVPEPAASVPSASGDPRWYTVLASLLVALGGVVIPVLGWVFGIAMVWVSKTWHRWEKWVASLVPLLLAGVIAFTLVAIRNLHRGELTGGTSSFPAFFDALWFGLLLTLGLNVLAGGWLLWRARGGR